MHCQNQEGSRYSSVHWWNLLSAMGVCRCHLQAPWQASHLRAAWPMKCALAQCQTCYLLGYDIGRKKVLQLCMSLHISSTLGIGHSSNPQDKWQMQQVDSVWASCWAQTTLDDPGFLQWGQIVSPGSRLQWRQDRARHATCAFLTHSMKHIEVYEVLSLWLTVLQCQICHIYLAVLRCIRARYHSSLVGLEKGLVAQFNPHQFVVCRAPLQAYERNRMIV